MRVFELPIAAITIITVIITVITKTRQLMLAGLVGCFSRHIGVAIGAAEPRDDGVRR